MISKQIQINRPKPPRRYQISNILKENETLPNKGIYYLLVEQLMARRYYLLRGPRSSSCGRLWPSAEAFLALQAKTSLKCCFGLF